METKPAFSLDEFEAAALPHRHDLYRAARHAVGNAAEAEDLVQEVYLQAWKSFHRFEPGTNCRAWLFKILFHVVHHHRRKWWKFEWVTDGDESSVFDTMAWEPPVAQHLSDEDVLAALDKLPPRFREAVLLADVQEFSYKEVADVLSIPIGTVMSRLNRGRKLLRAELAGLAASYGVRRAKSVGSAA
jgi:RNA polymerase sigma-70 factor, ECF subfamily